MPDEQMNILRFIDIGQVDYRESLDLQESIRSAVEQGSQESQVIFVEHPAVLTFGKHGKSENLLTTPAKLAEQSIQIFETDRGGQITAHEPGQLVMYPILSITHFKLTPKNYVCALEKSVIKLLADIGIASETDKEHPGIWVGNDKICAIGVRIKGRVTMHGIALNVDNLMTTFAHIVPCGIKNRGVTSIKACRTDYPAMGKIKQKLSENFAEFLGCQELRVDVSHRLQSNEMTPMID